MVKANKQATDEFNPPFVRWVLAPINTGTGTNKKPAGTGKVLIPLPADDETETFASYVAWLGGPKVLLKYLDGNGIRVRGQAIGRGEAEDGKPTDTEAAKPVIVEKLRNPGSRIGGSGGLNAARERAYEAAYQATYEMAIEMGLSETDAERMASTSANRAADAVKVKVDPDAAPTE